MAFDRASAVPVQETQATPKRRFDLASARPVAGSGIDSPVARFVAPLAGGLTASAMMPEAAMAGAELGGAIGGPFAPVTATLGGLAGAAMPFTLGAEGVEAIRRKLSDFAHGTPERFPTPEEIGKGGMQSIQDYLRNIEYLGVAGAAGKALEAIPQVAPALAKVPILSRFFQPKGILHAAASNYPAGEIVGGHGMGVPAALTAGTIQAGANIGALPGAITQAKQQVADAGAPFDAQRLGIEAEQQNALQMSEQAKAMRAQQLGQAQHEAQSGLERAQRARQQERAVQESQAKATLTSETEQVNQQKLQEVTQAEQALQSKLSTLSATKEAMTKALPVVARNKVTSMRTGGVLADAVQEHIQSRTQGAWDVVKAAASKIKRVFTSKDIESSFVKVSKGDPALLESIQAFAKRVITTPDVEEDTPDLSHQVVSSLTSEEISRLYPTHTVEVSGGPKIIGRDIPRGPLTGDLTATDLVDLASKAGQRIPKGIYHGHDPMTGKYLPVSEFQSAIYDLVDSAAPKEVKGELQRGRALYKDAATHRGLLYDYFDLRASKEAPSDAKKGGGGGEELLMRAASDALTPSEADLLSHLPPELVQKATDSLRILHEEIGKVSQAMTEKEQSLKDLSAQKKVKGETQTPAAQQARATLKSLAASKSSDTPETLRFKEELQAIAKSIEIEKGLSVQDQSDIKARMEEKLKAIGLSERGARAAAQAHLDVLNKQLGQWTALGRYAMRFVGFRLLWKAMRSSK